MATVHDEGKDIFVPISFFDERHVPVAPLSASYRVTKGDDTELLPWTPVGTLAASVEVIVPATLNLVAGTGTETRHVAIKFTYGSPTRTGTAGIEYSIRNLKAYV
jgi:hypothetical protein